MPDYGPKHGVDFREITFWAGLVGGDPRTGVQAGAERRLRRATSSHHRPCAHGRGEAKAAGKFTFRRAVRGHQESGMGLLLY